eukprot:337562-Pelagomonas_calceolata.AAC.2
MAKRPQGMWEAQRGASQMYSGDEAYTCDPVEPSQCYIDARQISAATSDDEMHILGSTCKLEMQLEG